VKTALSLSSSPPPGIHGLTHAQHGPRRAQSISGCLGRMAPGDQSTCACATPRPSWSPLNCPLFLSSLVPESMCRSADGRRPISDPAASCSSRLSPGQMGWCTRCPGPVQAVASTWCPRARAYRRTTRPRARYRARATVERTVSPDLEKVRCARAAPAGFHHRPAHRGRGEQVARRRGRQRPTIQPWCRSKSRLPGRVSGGHAVAVGGLEVDPDQRARHR